MKTKIYIVIWSVILIAADQITKISAFNKLRPVGNVTVLQGILDFTYVENRGAAFGIFQGHTWILAIVSMIFLAIIFYIIITDKFNDKKLCYVGMIIFAGGMGNQIDRIFRGYVVDFIDLSFQPFKSFPVFNIADCFVSIGAVLLIVYTIFFDKQNNKYNTNES